MTESEISDGQTYELEGWMEYEDDAGSVDLSVQIELGLQIIAYDFCFCLVANQNLEKVSFSGDNDNKYYEVQRDDTGEGYEAPHWFDKNLDGDAQDDEEHRYPVCYERGTKPTVEAVVKINLDVRDAKIKMKGSAPGGISFPPKLCNAAFASGWTTVTYPATISAGAFKDEVDFLNSLVITWKISTNDGKVDSWLECGESDNSVYVFYDEP